MFLANTFIAYLHQELIKLINTINKSNGWLAQWQSIGFACGRSLARARVCSKLTFLNGYVAFSEFYRGREFKPPWGRLKNSTQSAAFSGHTANAQWSLWDFWITLGEWEAEESWGNKFKLEKELRLCSKKMANFELFKNGSFKIKIL